MTFTTTTFIILFLPLLLIGTFFSRKNVLLNRIFILIANCIFYLWAGKKAIAFLFVYSLVTYLFLLFLSKSPDSNKKKVCIIECILLLIPLFFIKYGNYIIPNQYIFFPLGVSFFSFQAVSLIADYYNKKIEKKPGIFQVFSYLTFFVTVVSGPITRYNTFSNGFQKNSFSTERLNSGIERFTIGLSKKMLLADKLSIISSYYFDGIANHIVGSTAGMWIGALAYSLQLYFDFSGYSDMAIGIGEILGFQIPENFNYPYTAKSISDFWRKWHISLSQWFRDYIYIPLGGNRCSVLRHIFNMLVVWLFTGIWHGSTWNFIVWGLLYFALLILEKYCKSFASFLEKHKVFGHLYSLFFILLLWIIFNTPDLEAAKNYILALIGINSKEIQFESFALHSLPFIIICCIATLPLKNFVDSYSDKTIYRIFKVIFMLIIFVLSFASVLNSSYVPFIYGKF